MNRNDLKRDFLTKSGYVGTLQGQTKEFFRVATASLSTDPLAAVAQKYWAINGGGTGPLLDVKKKALQSKGYSGSVQDMETQFWYDKSFGLPLDAITIPAAFAASTRKLKAGYNGPAMRVRRSSDNAEADIGFLSNGDLDVFSLMNHVGGENLITYSQDFYQAIWTVSGIVLGNTIPSPVGMASKVVADITNTNHNIRNITLGGMTAASPTTVSMMVQAAEYNKVGIVVDGNNGRAWFDLKTATANLVAGTGAAIFPMAGFPGWFICSLTFNAVSANANIWCGVLNTGMDPVGSFVGDGVSGVYLAAVWANNGTTAQDYCKTTATPKAADSGFVSKYYDQSGNGRDLVQATAANQPRIVNAGVIDRIPNTKVKNGLFSTGDTTGWLTAGGANGVVAAGEYQNAMATQNQYQDITVTPNVPLTLSGIIRRISGATGNPRIYAYDGANFVTNIGEFPPNTGSLQTRTVTPTGNTLRLYLYNNSDGTVGFSKIKVTPVNSGDQPAVITDGVAQSLTSPSFVLPQPVTRSSVLQLLTMTAGKSLINSRTRAPNTALYFYTGATIGMYAGANLSFASPLVTQDLGTYVETYNGAASSGSYNGAVSNGDPGSQGIDGITIGQAGDATSWSNAAFGDIIIYSGALTIQNRQTLEANQKTYYGTP